MSEQRRAAAIAVLEELDTIRERWASGPKMRVHSDTHNDLRAAITAPPDGEPKCENCGGNMTRYSSKLAACDDCANNRTGPPPKPTT